MPVVAFQIPMGVVEGTKDLVEAFVGKYPQGDIHEVVLPKDGNSLVPRVFQEGAGASVLEYLNIQGSAAFSGVAQKAKVCSRLKEFLSVCGMHMEDDGDSYHAAAVAHFHLVLDRWHRWARGRVVVRGVVPGLQRGLAHRVCGELAMGAPTRGNTLCIALGNGQEESLGVKPTSMVMPQDVRGFASEQHMPRAHEQGFNHVVPMVVHSGVYTKDLVEAFVDKYPQVGLHDVVLPKDENLLVPRVFQDGDGARVPENLHIQGTAAFSGFAQKAKVSSRLMEFLSVVGMHMEDDGDSYHAAAAARFHLVLDRWHRWARGRVVVRAGTVPVSSGRPAGRATSRRTGG